MDNLIGSLSAPAQRALAEVNIQQVEDFGKSTRYEIEVLHGVGKKVMDQIESRMAELGIKFKAEDESPEVDAYIGSFSGLAHQRLLEIRWVIRGVIPQARERIAYAMPTYYYRENVVHFAGFKKHIGFFPTPSGIGAFESETKKFVCSKGGIQFPLETEIPRTLVESIVEYRMREIRLG